MKQLLIVNSAKALDAGLTSHKVNDLSGLEAGAITFFELGSDTALSAAPVKNFAIALGMGAKSSPFVIPEVDIETLTVTETLPEEGVEFSVSFHAPAGTAKKDYTLIFVKKDTVPNQRNKFTITVSVGSSNLNSKQLAEKFVEAVNSKANALFDFTASKEDTSATEADVTITCNNMGELWNAVAADQLESTTLTITQGEPEIGGVDFIKNLASQCAAGKGFNYTAENAHELYPGYPEAVEALVPDDVSGSCTEGYSVFNLHFATKRDFGKQMDERVWQNVHIAVPVNNASYSDIQAILSGASKYLTKAAADELYEPIGEGD